MKINIKQQYKPSIESRLSIELFLLLTPELSLSGLNIGPDGICPCEGEANFDGEARPNRRRDPDQKKYKHTKKPNIRVHTWEEIARLCT